jgi:hypothetical protein
VAGDNSERKIDYFFLDGKKLGGQETREEILSKVVFNPCGNMGNIHPDFTRFLVLARPS